MRERPLRVTVLLSGSGTTLENLFLWQERGDLPVEFVKVISSRADAYGLERAKQRHVPTQVVASREFKIHAPAGKRVPDWETMSAALSAAILPDAPDLVVFAGFMCRFFLPPELAGKVMNIHPALIPSFCGQGMYGHHVHEAVAAAGVKVTGCTVHFVTNEYDAGPIILQRTCPVFDADSPGAVAQRVGVEERQAYPEAIRLFADGRLQIQGTRVKILPPEERA